MRGSCFLLRPTHTRAHTAHQPQTRVWVNGPTLIMFCSFLLYIYVMYIIFNIYHLMNFLKSICSCNCSLVQEVESFYYLRASPTGPLQSSLAFTGNDVLVPMLIDLLDLLLKLTVMESYVCLASPTPHDNEVHPSYSLYQWASDCFSF